MPKLWRKFPRLGKIFQIGSSGVQVKMAENRDFRNWHAPCNALCICPSGQTEQPLQGDYTMNTNYKAGDLRHTIAAVVCTIVFGSTFLLGAVAPGTAVAAPRTTVTQTAA
jgi:hypothetical protein